MRSIVATLAIFAAQAAAYSVTSELERKFIFWAAQYGKEYLNMQEFGLRLQNWIKQEKEIQRVNSIHNETVTLGHNQFSDWSDAEYKAMLGF